MSAGLLILGALTGCGALYTPPEPVLGPPLTARSATVTDLGQGVAVRLEVESGLRRDRLVGAGAFELSGESGTLARSDRTPLSQVVSGGSRATVEWRTPLEASLGAGGLAGEAPFVLSGTLWLEGPGRHTELVPFTLSASLVAEDPVETP